jgi:hypothetical protein
LPNEPSTSTSPHDSIILTKLVTPSNSLPNYFANLTRPLLHHVSL